MKNSTNCLALTIRKEYRLTVIKNVTTKSIHIASKVIFAVVALNVVNLFVQKKPKRF